MIKEKIRSRRSVRTFNGRPLAAEDTKKIAEYMKTIRNPYDIPVAFVLLDAEKYSLSSPVLTGESVYVAAIVEKVSHAEEAIGFSFEKLLLYAWTLGIGSTWIGGTMKRELFEKAAGVNGKQLMPCVSPLGYPAERMSLRENVMRKGVKANERKDSSELFFDRNFHDPLKEENSDIAEALELVRFAPSAVNRQPWRVVRDGKNYHFYLKHDRGYVGEATGDLQKVDMGIAICHFMCGVSGDFRIDDPGLTAESGTEYIATVAL